MGRRPVTLAAPPSDGAVGSVVGAVSSSAAPGKGLPRSNGTHPSPAAAGAAAAKAHGKEDGKNPLMGLLHYGSDSDDGEDAPGSSPAAKTKLRPQDSGVSHLQQHHQHQQLGAGASSSSPPPASSDLPSAAGEEVTYVLPAGWQQCKDSTGLVYFWNTATDDTAWDPPVGTQTRRSITPTAAAAAADAVTPSTEAPVDYAKGVTAADAAGAAAVAAGGIAVPGSGDDAEQAGSDATSDTASELEDDQTEGGETGEAAAGFGAVRSSQSGIADGSGGNDTKGRAKDAEEEKDGEEGEVPPRRGAAPAAANAGGVRSLGPAAGVAAGVDDLLAGIEAELLLDGGDGGGKRSGARGGGAGTKSEEGIAAEGGEEEEDFSPLRLVGPKLDMRAREAHAELISSLSAVGKKMEDGAGGVADGEGEGERAGAGTLCIELAAVLRARISDWKEGGLDGVFFVKKLEDMAAQARSALGLSAPAAMAADPSRGTRNSAVVTPEATADRAPDGTPSSLEAEFPVGDGSIKEGRTVVMAAAAADAQPAAGGKASGVSKKRRRAPWGGAKSAATSAAAGGAAFGAAQAEKGAGAGMVDEEDIQATGATDDVDADADARAESLRAERNAQQLKWADEVSAAAAAAVAAAAALSQARKEQAKVEMRVKAAAASRKKGTEGPGSKGSGGRRSGAASASRATAPAPAAKAGKIGTTAETSDGASAEIIKSTVEGAIELGGVGDDDSEEERIGEPPTDAAAAAAAAAGRAGGVGSRAAPAKASEVGETGIVIAKESTPAGLPSGWAAVFDETSQAFYYHNLATDETTWVLPTDSTAPLAPATAAVAATRAADTAGTSSKSTPNRGKERETEVPPTESKKAKPDQYSGDAGSMTRTKRSQQEDFPGARRDDGEVADMPGSGTASDACSVGTRWKGAETTTAAVSAVSVDGDAAAGETSTHTGDEGRPAAATATTKDGEAKEANSASSTGSLPSPWVAVWDGNQQAYYFHNTATDETSWEPPPSPTPVAASAAAVPAAAVTDDSPAPPASSKIQKKQRITKTSRADAAPSGDTQRRTSPAAAEGVDASTSAAAYAGDPSAPENRRGSSLAPVTTGTAAPADASTLATTPAAAAVDLRPSTLVWWSDAGDVWNGPTLSGLLGGYGPRRYRNLGGGYYMTTLELGAELATAAVAALGQGVADPVAAARVDWVNCTASAPGYGLFLRFSGDDDELKLFDVPDEYFEDPPPDPAIVAAEEAAAAAFAAQAEAADAAAAAALAEAEAAAENAEMEAAALEAVAATREAEAAGGAVAAAAAVAATSTAATAPSTASKKRKTKGSLSGAGKSAGSIGKKRKGAAHLIDKWKAVASTAGEEAEEEAKKQEKMERWKARAAALDPDNPNFAPIGRKRT